MKTYLWTVVVLTAIELSGRLVWMARGKLPERTMSQTLVDAVACIVFVVWGAVLLARAA